MSLPLLGWFVGPAAAGPDWLEHRDAGSLPAIAQLAAGSGELGAIDGELAGQGAILGADFEDMYVIFISDPPNFRATTDPRDPVLSDACADFDTQLFLFRPTVGETTDALGVLGNNDHPNSNPQSQRSLLIEISDDGKTQVTDCGLYYLAISGRGNVPQSSGLDLFAFASLTEISGPDGPGGAAVIDGWSGAGGSGAYRIVLQGVTFASCPWDCASDDGQVNVDDFLGVLAQWAQVCTSCDLGEGAAGVGVDEFLAVLANWGPCPDPTPPPSDCCTPHLDVGCDDQFCEADVCGLLPDCCALVWDQACADVAANVCQVCVGPDSCN